MEIPQRLYKYRAPTIQDITALSDGKLWFSSPARFNDPFDCAYDVAISNLSRAELISAVEKATDGRFNKANLASVSDENLKRHVGTGLKSGVDKGRSAVSGVCCFSAIPDDLLLWGHYSDGHRGFCLEFDTSADPLFRKAKKVHYSNAIPSLGVQIFLRDDYSKILESMLTKAECWKYEQEWRVLHKDAEFAFGYERSSLTGVYFGARMPDQQVQMIASLLSRDAKLYRMHLSKSRFELVPQVFTFTRIEYGKDQPPAS